MSEETSTPEILKDIVLAYLNSLKLANWQALFEEREVYKNFFKNTNAQNAIALIQEVLTERFMHCEGYDPKNAEPSERIAAFLVDERNYTLPTAAAFLVTHGFVHNEGSDEEKNQNLKARYRTIAKHVCTSADLSSLRKAAIKTHKANYPVLYRVLTPIVTILSLGFVPWIFHIYKQIKHLDFVTSDEGKNGNPNPGGSKLSAQLSLAVSFVPIWGHIKGIQSMHAFFADRDQYRFAKQNPKLIRQHVIKQLLEKKFNVQPEAFIRFSQEDLDLFEDPKRKKNRKEGLHNKQGEVRKDAEIGLMTQEQCARLLYRHLDNSDLLYASSDKAMSGASPFAAIPFEPRINCITPLQNYTKEKIADSKTVSKTKHSNPHP